MLFFQFVLYYIFASVRAAGGPVREYLAREISALRNTPLDEGPGEGWHRHSNQTVQRASAAKMPWVLGSVRTSQNLDTARKVIQDHGAVGAKVWRYEWLKYKRLLRPTEHKRFFPPSMPDSVFSEAVQA